MNDILLRVECWIILSIATERATELIVSSKIFDPLRSYIKCIAYSDDKPPEDNFAHRFIIMVDYFLSCGYCASVWVAGFFAMWSLRFLETPLIDWIVSTLLLHGLANFYHVFYEIVRRGRVQTHDVMLKLSCDGELRICDNRAKNCSDVVINGSDEDRGSDT